MRATPDARHPGARGIARVVPPVVVALLLAAPAAALVHYDQGRRQIQGVLLLQDSTDADAYYYVPQFPRLATRDDGGLEFLCMKYVDSNGGASGGLLHALVEFTLPAERLARLEEELKREVPGARIAGPVPLLEAVEDGEEGMGSFRIVSAVLSDRREGGFTREVISSGKAPLMPGSKAVVAAILERQGATLLWDSFRGPNSDVSVAIHAYYEAKVRGYDARVRAEVDTLYRHFSRVENAQAGFKRRQVRKIVDDLRRDGTLDVEVLDRSEALGISVSEMDSVLQVVTDRLTELMFDHESGWSTEPPREAALEQGQIKGRQEQGILSRVFGKPRDVKYYTDDQYVLKRREDIRRNRFEINLAKDTTIRVPVDTAGNLGGLYAEMGEDPRYFRVVGEDPDFESRAVHFQVDSAFLDSFRDTVNSVAVHLRKRITERPDITRDLTFTHEDIQAGRTIKTVEFPRLGERSADWLEYEYQVRWSLRDGPSVSVPPSQGEWIRTRDAAVSLTPPFGKRVVEIDADRSLFAPAGVRTAVVEVATVLGGQETRLQRKAALRALDADPVSRFTVYHDREAEVRYRVTWHSPERSMQEDLEPLESDFLFLAPPEPGGQEEPR